jgi:hypothetical protein
VTAPSIAVLVPTEGRHLFDNIHDPRVRVTADAAVPEPRLIVFPVSRFRRFDNLASLSLPDAVLQRIANRQTGLVFDASLEGVQHKPDITAALHAMVEKFGASREQCVYLTQDRQYAADYGTYCSDHHLSPVTVMTHDYWLWDALGQFESTAEQAYQARLVAFTQRPPVRSRRFVSLNRTPRPTKILFLLRLLRDGLWEQGHISFGGFREKTAGPGKERPAPEQLLKSLAGFDDLIQQLTPFIDQLDAYGRVLLGLQQHGWRRIELTQASQAVDLAEYSDSWFTVVTETEMRRHPSRITEKVVKPLVNFHPLVVLGNPAALKMIRSYGFVTFDEVVDEGYDDEWDPRRRFDRVYAEVTRLCAMSEEDLQRLEERITEKLIFNARWGLTRFPSIYREQRDTALVNDLLAATGRVQ